MSGQDEIIEALWDDVAKLQKELEEAKKQLQTTEERSDRVHEHYLFELDRANKAESEKAVLVEALKKIARYPRHCSVTNTLTDRHDDMRCMAKAALAQISEAGDGVVDESNIIPAHKTGITVRVGKDGAWVCFSAQGKHYAFQPITSPLNRQGIARLAIKAWTADMQALSTNKEQDNE